MANVARLVLRARAAAERLMVDACTVVRVTGETEGPGGVLTAATTPIYSGKCRVQVRTRERMGGSWQSIGEAQLILARIEVQIPISAAELKEADIVTMTSSTLDPIMVGKQFQVRDVMMKTHLSARRATVIELSS